MFVRLQTHLNCSSLSPPTEPNSSSSYVRQPGYLGGLTLNIYHYIMLYPIIPYFFCQGFSEDLPLYPTTSQNNPIMWVKQS